MTGSSDDRRRELAKIRTGAIGALLRAIARSKRSEARFVEGRYAESNVDFHEHLRFLQRLRWVEESKGELRLSDSGQMALEASQSAVQVRRVLLSALTANDSPYRRAIADYVSLFRLEEGRLFLQQNITDRTKSASVRDVLMDLRVVEYVGNADKYRLCGDGRELYVWGRNERLSGAGRRLRERADAQRTLGERAELVAVEFERARLGKELANLVTRVSETIEFASYDIKSVTVVNGAAVARYIEVKAVSAETEQFFWTRAEIECAEILGSKYFLYLVPVHGGQIDSSAIRVINDPHRSVFKNEKEWSVEENVVVCAPRRAG